MYATRIEKPCTPRPINNRQRSRPVRSRHRRSDSPSARPPRGPRDQFAEDAQQIARSVPDVEPDAVEWLPLGVFALCQDDGETTGPAPTIFIQLAISKEGIIAGTLQNTATDNAFEVEGTIDPKSQRAAWGRVGAAWPIMETGIANLTRDETPALLHFDDGQTQQWLLVRLEEPDEATESR